MIEGFRGGAIPSCIVSSEYYGPVFDTDCINRMLERERFFFREPNKERNKMAKYTKDDVIITEKQAEKAGLKKGMTVYGAQMPKNCVDGAEGDRECYRGTLEKISWTEDRPFRILLDNPSVFGPVEIDTECVVIKKEPTYKAFNLKNEEHRKMLRGRTITKKMCNLSHIEEIITVISDASVETEHHEITPEGLVTHYVFTDGPHKGEPVGVKED